MIEPNNEKYRMVSFRVSSSEYARAYEICKANRYRSLSLFAKSALLAFSPSPAPDPYEPQIRQLQDRIESLTLELTRVLKHIHLSPDPDDQTDAVVGKATAAKP
jgi:hypothetical protein